MCVCVWVLCIYVCNLLCARFLLSFLICKVSRVEQKTERNETGKQTLPTSPPLLPPSTTPANFRAYTDCGTLHRIPTITETQSESDSASRGDVNANVKWHCKTAHMTDFSRA